MTEGAFEAPSLRYESIAEPNVSIIVLNWNGAEDTIACVSSLFAIDYWNFEIIIVDNGSTDESPELIERQVRTILNQSHAAKESVTRGRLGNDIQVIPEPTARDAIRRGPAGFSAESKVLLIRNERNLGFAAGNNIGIQFAVGIFRPKYVFLLNNDTVVEPTFLAKLVSTMEREARLGILGPRLVEDAPIGSMPETPCPVGRIHWARYPGFSYGAPRWRQNQRMETGLKHCDWVSGAALLVRTKCLEDGLLNTEYFFGYEDVELSLKLRKLGWRVGVRPDAVVWHKGGVARRKRYRTAMSRLISGAMGAFRFVRNNRRDYLLFWYVYTLTVAFLVLKLKFADILGARIDLTRVLRRLQ